MSESIVDLFRAQVPAGMKVTLFLTNGKEYRGSVMGVSGTMITLDTQDGALVINEKLLGGWQAEALRQVDIAPDEAGQEVPVNRAVLRRTSTETAPLDAAVNVRLAEISARYDLGTQQLALKQPPPDFDMPQFSSFPTGQRLEIRKAIDRARSQFEYAARVSEPGRLVGAAAQLRAAAEDFPAVRGLHALVAQLLITSHRFSDARELCEREWRVSGLPAAAFGAAYCCLALNDFPGACRYLARFVAASADHSLPQDWFVLVGLIRRLKAHDLWDEIIRSVWTDQSQAPIVVACAEALIYCLRQVNLDTRAREITNDLIEQSIRADLLSAASRDLQQAAATSPERLWTDHLDRERKEEAERAEKAKLDALENRRRQVQQQLRMVPNGRVRFLNRDRGYGFVTDIDGTDRWFRLTDVGEAALAKDLVEGASFSQMPVAFEPYESDGRPRARNLRYPRTVDHVLENARALFQGGQRSRGQSELRAVLEAFPGHGAALELQREFAIAPAPPPAKPTPPRGESDYARATRAQLDHDPEKAEPLFRRAIERGQNKDAAVKGLAMLLGQDRKEEAVALLEHHLPTLSDKRPALNILATTLTHMDRHERAIDVLEKVRQLSTPHEVPGVLKRMAYSHYILKDYEASERLLEQVLEMTPGDVTALRSRATLIAARESGVYTAADEVFDKSIFTEVSYNVSPTLKFALDRCDFAGVNDAILAVRNFTQTTLNSVGDLIERQRGRPRERARYLLTYARLMQELGSEDDTTFRATLFSYACAIGDSAASQGKSLDIVRAYYSEALFLQDQWEPVANRVVQYLRSFVVRSEELLPIGGKSAPLDDTIALVCSQPAIPTGFWDGVLDMCVISRSVAQNLVPRFWRNARARASSISFLGVDIPNESEEQYAHAWDLARQRRAKEANDWFEQLASLTRTGLNAATCESVAKSLELFRAAWLPSIDQQRLGRAVTVLHSAKSLFQVDFEERERSYHVCMTQADALQRDIEENPTRFAVGGLYPMLDRVKAQLNSEFESVLRDTAPRVNLSLAVDEVIPDKDGKARVQVRVSNDRGSQPITGVSIRLENEAGECWPLRASFDYADVVRGDDSAVVQCDVSLTSQAIAARAVSVTASLAYRDRKGDQATAPPQKLSLRLYPVSEFVPIENPFAQYAEGGAVRDTNMFYGRDGDVENVTAALIRSEAKCVVIFGQKRAGKSTVLHHLQARLNASDKVLAVQLSLGAVVAEFSLQALFYRMASQLCDTLAGLKAQGLSVPEPEVITYGDFRENATMAFVDFLRRYRAKASVTKDWTRTRLVFLIDEFTYLYSAIKTGRVTPDVMKTWKALLEEGQFSAVLVGQDVMPRFKMEFPNEFGVTQDMRLSHLREADASRLLDEPIRIGGPSGESRYKSKAMGRALDITSGSAYYAQMFGNRLVDYMNDVKAPYVTEADVDRVVAGMVLGVESLEKDKFDNLITAGDSATDIYPEQDVIRVLAAISRGSRGGLCSRHLLIDENIDSLDGILADLVARDVVDEPTQGYYRIHVGLFDEWLFAHYGGELKTAGASL